MASATVAPRAGFGRQLLAGLTIAVTSMGHMVGLALLHVGQVFSLGHRIVVLVMRGQLMRRELFQQMCICGVSGLPLVLVTLGAVGMVFAVYFALIFKQFGGSEFLGGIISLAMVREIGPLLGATVIAARTGSAIAAEVATMKVTEQLDALRALATDPIEYLATPRYVALAITVPLLVLFGTATGILGAGLLSTLDGIPLRQFFKSVTDMVGADQLMTGLIKSVVFGELIAIVSLHQGFRCGLGSEAVGRATTQSVVLCVLWIHTTNLLLAVAAS